MAKENKTGPSVKKTKKAIVPKHGKIEEVSPEALAQRQKIEDLLIFGADLYAKETTSKRQRDQEEIELLSGKKITIEEIKSTVTALRQPYAPMFGNDIPFFTEMYRLLGLTENPHSFSKPAYIGKYINQIIYARYHKDVQPALQALAVPGGIRMNKFFQFLTTEGQEKLQQFRDEAIAIMKECSTWYEFRVKYGKQYNLPVQKRMFES
jgi:hypothetical protein